MAGAVLNLYVAICWPLASWINFKVFGLLLLTLLFTLISGLWVYRQAASA